jgi:ABC-type transporter Mla MlaB component
MTQPSDTVATWTVPTALNHSNWQHAKIECTQAIEQHLANTSVSPAIFIFNWQQCTTIDSSALAFVLALKRKFSSSALTITHQKVSPQLMQLAQLYDVDGFVGFSS